MTKKGGVFMCISESESIASFYFCQNSLREGMNLDKFFCQKDAKGEFVGP